MEQVKRLGFLSLTLLALSLSSCSIFPDFDDEPRIVTVTETVYPIIPLQTSPKPINLNDVEFYVVSDKNIDEFLERFVEENGSLAFVAMTVKGYENLSINLQELRRYILQQKQIIVYYEKSVTFDDKKEENTEENTSK